jgi:hypothetical protein
MKKFLILLFVLFLTIPSYSTITSKRTIRQHQKTLRVKYRKRTGKNYGKFKRIYPYGNSKYYKGIRINKK